MANPSAQKRDKERQRAERQRDKDARRLLRREEKPARDAGSGEDPDLAGIVAGPQPVSEE